MLSFTLAGGAAAQSSLGGAALPPPVPAQRAAPPPTPPAAPRAATPPATAPATTPRAAAPPRPGTARQAAPADTPASRRRDRPATPPRQAPAAARPPRPEAEVKRPRTAAAAAAAAAATAAAAAQAAAPAAPPPEPTPPQIGSVTGLQLPRFVTLRSDEVNMRAGPGTRFRIEWTYQRRDLPVEIVREYDLWRRIRDHEGTEGWVHSSTLAGRRTAMIRDGERRLRRRPEDGAATVARLEPGVIGRIRACPPGPWCEIRVADHTGFIRRDEVWGVLPDEVLP
ncbi:SH3-like domain-containing protein [Humitalea rosea]|uniref:SH3-like domain-containing protein n=2 Tax=Humitalea rosea TaxID=990373 RepID=A0A2W7IMJ2_9PROT|nr:SH3-like domain-containing protein [Humitalea rosea]